MLNFRAYARRRSADRDHRFAAREQALARIIAGQPDALRDGPEGDWVLRDLMKAMRGCPQPLIGLVHGPTACGGMALALAFPSIPFTLLGFAAAGWGVATVVPAVFYAGYHIPGLPHGAGLAIVNWLLRFAFLIGPPLVGRISDVVNFRVALLVMPLATLMVVLLSGHLSTGRSHEEQPA